MTIAERIIFAHGTTAQLNEIVYELCRVQRAGQDRERELKKTLTQMEEAFRDVARSLGAACRLAHTPARDGSEASMNEHVGWAAQLVRRALRIKPSMTIHELKVWPAEFAAVRAGTKKYEIRKNDRDFKVGDGLLLKEWDPARCTADSVEIGYTDEWERRRIAHITPGGQWGLPPDVCVLGFE